MSMSNQMESFLLEESQSEREDQHSDSNEDSTTKESSIPEDEKSLAQITGAQKAITFKVRGTIQGKKVISLIGIGTTHNFIDA